jgi:alkyl sulfatase BDS1-like metallo-beta-lactamase superfamily hydrolase
MPAEHKSPPLASIVGKHQQQTEAVSIGAATFMSPDVSNSYLVNTDAGAVLINTGTVVGRSRNKAAFDKIRSGPYLYIILTQSHPDHFGGVVAFKEPKTKVIAERRFRDTRAYYAAVAPTADPRTFKLWEAVLGLADMKAMTTFDEVVPDIEVNEHSSLNVGGRRFELYSAPGGETVDSLVVHLPDDGTVFTGNLFGPAWMSVPNLYTIRGDKIRSATQYLRSLKQVQGLLPDKLITGHGEPIEGRQHIQECLSAMYEATRYVHDETVAGMNAGKSLQTLMAEIQLPGHLKVGQLHGKVSWNVRAIWTEYLGWFEYRSTTELYPVSAAVIAPDLVELAGADNLLRRAKAHLAAGRPLNALHLIEVVLNAQPDHAGALQAKIQAHQSLLERCSGENLSETMWLKSEVRAAERALAKN